MTDKTANREYNIPEAGDTDWGEPISENWESIDADIQTAFEMVEAALEAAAIDDETGGDDSTTDAETTDSDSQ